MTTIRKLLTVAAIFAATGPLQAGPAMAGELKLESVPTTWARPYDLQVEQTQAGIRVTGRLRSTSANTTRRLRGRVAAEFVDRDGHVVAIRYADVRRDSPAKHTASGRFDIDIERIPESTAEIRVRYQRS